MSWLLLVLALAASLVDENRMVLVVGGLGEPAGRSGSEIEAELERGLALHREGRTSPALQIYEQVIHAAARDGSSDAARLAAVAWQAKCQFFCDEERWSEALDASSEFLAQYKDAEDLRVRWALSNVRLVFSRAVANLSLASTGEIGEFADPELNELIAWLRAQPEPAFAGELARSLRLKVRWHARDEAGLDALEELVDVLARTGDPELVRELADRLLQATPLLFAPSQHEREHVAEVLEDSDQPLEPEDVFSERHRHRMVRLARSFNELAELLGSLSQRRSTQAAELRAAMLLHVCTALARLGQVGAAEQVFMQLARLDQAALAACDRTDEDEAAIALQTNGDALPHLVATAVLKARIHATNGRTKIAVDALEDVTRTYHDNDSPWIAAALEEADELREELRSEPEPAAPTTPASPQQTNSTSARVVWRTGL